MQAIAAVEGIRLSVLSSHRFRCNRGPRAAALALGGSSVCTGMYVCEGAGKHAAFVHTLEQVSAHAAHNTTITRLPTHSASASTKAHTIPPILSDQFRSITQRE